MASLPLQFHDVLRSIHSKFRRVGEKLARLRAEIPKLPGDPDPGAVEALRSKYPELSDKQWAMVLRSVDGAVQGEHQRFLDSLANFEQSHNDGSNPESLSEWIRRWGMY